MIRQTDEKDSIWFKVFALALQDSAIFVPKENAKKICPGTLSETDSL
jgi:hypothetical protein